MLARDVGLVIADEPTANLDRELAWQTVAVFRRLAERVPVLVITHDPEVAEACDRTIVLQSAGDAAESIPQPAVGARRSRRTPWAIGAGSLIVALAIVLIAALHYENVGTVSAGTAVPASSSAASGNPARSTPTVRSMPPAAASAPIPSAAPAPPGMTVIKLFTPFDVTSGKPLVRVAFATSGSCIGGSDAVNDPDAYRCFTADNQILDPCFRSTVALNPTQLICVGAPWDETATELSLTQSLPFTSANSGPADPTWALQLSNGAHCTQATGATDSVAGVDMTYYCQGSAEAGGLNREGPLWTVEYATAGSSTVTTVAVTTAWG